jgi:hypothetical protein
VLLAGCGTEGAPIREALGEQNFPLDADRQTRLEKTVGFQFVLPCYLPSDLLPGPIVVNFRKDQIRFGWKPLKLGGGSYPLRVFEEVSHMPNVRADGPPKEIAGVEAAVQGGNSSASIDWIQNGLHFSIAGSYGTDQLELVARSMIQGCADHP